jgi:hypothetical protein
MADGSITSRTGGVTLARMFLVEDPRGCLSGGGFPEQLPFQPVRYFVVFGVPEGQVRGEHAHRRCQQFFIALNGSVRVTIDDATMRETIVLDRPEMGLYVPPLVWSTQADFSPGALLLVLASDPYDPEEYIRRYDEFLALRGQSARQAP